MSALPLAAKDAGTAGARLLDVEDLQVSFSTRRGRVEAVRGVSLSLDAGETLGIVGESGSGKSVTAFAVTHLLEAAGRITGGRIAYRGRDITRASWKTLRSTHGAAISMIFQNPRAALNPIRTVGLQIADALRVHADLGAAEARERALGLLRDVMIREPEKRLDAYPHELSGGMCQRVMIAMAIASEPALLIADEPTTGLDVTTQKTVMDLLADIARRRGMAIILITHDLGLAATYCQRVVVMEQGRIVEQAPPLQLFQAPRHPYTQRLVAASPTPTSTIADLVAGTPEGAAAPARLPVAQVPQPPGTPPLLEVQGVAKHFDGGIVAVHDVSFRLARGESLGLVGESGSGKSTLSRILCRLIDATHGEVLFDGQTLSGIPARDFHRSPLRREVQLVFQDPHDSLNPRFSAWDCIAHPLRRLMGLKGHAELDRAVRDCAARAGLPGELLDRFPHQLSGGQKARVGIARAIACKPRLLILDEPTAALDVSVQAVILQLLDRLRREEGLAFVFVSHDLNVVRMMCERTLVLRNGRVVEEGRSTELFSAPQSDYTRALIDAIPHVALAEPRKRAA
ncbi:dipeptide ABC transporter ATP-binding protein [Pseudacidovorax sp. NFM-22]|uniref:dipeptide ABC transporter ATP-binding protein n=1 Tax=Pseudacidovorax sp. NFM-22 TaxID=2744469 RepID=UPI001F47936C|nr:ABC transporter ATP-binding protein [Pseudacidovorax sp. NFM-22]